MRAVLALIMLFPLVAVSETVINYDDGSTYTLSEGEKIYVSTTKVFDKRNYSNGSVHFKLRKEHTSRDYVPQPTDGMTAGSHEWCKTYVPWSEGFTFAMQTWVRHCDTNNDGSYGCGDDTFDASEDASVCPS
tara:strand:- start:202 stop:597 length:396 start_codon:yes stop_codon:yes gene_type:complete